MAINPKYIIIHHTSGSDTDPLADSSNFTFEQCNELHRQNFNFKSSLGYYIGYTYYIEKDGTVKQGRLDTEEGAHTVGRNKDSIGVCLSGNFDLTLPTSAQTEALKGLLRRKTAQYGIIAENVVPHRKFAAKTCYGTKLADSWARGLLVDPQSNAETVRKIEELLKLIK